MQGPFNQSNGEKEFEKKFRDKTKNAWADRENFVPHDGKYEIVDMDPTAGGGAGGAAAAAGLSKVRCWALPFRKDRCTCDGHPHDGSFL